MKRNTKQAKESEILLQECLEAENFKKSVSLSRTQSKVLDDIMAKIKELPSNNTEQPKEAEKGRNSSKFTILGKQLVFDKSNLTEAQLEAMLPYKEFFQVSRIHDPAELSTSFEEGKLLSVHNDSDVPIMSLFFKAYAFEGVHGRKSAKYDPETGKSFFACCLRILVRNDLPVSRYAELAAFVADYFELSDCAYVVVAESKGIGTYLKIITTMRKFYPEGIEKKHYAKYTAIREMKTGYLKKHEVGDEVPEGYKLAFYKGDLLKTDRYSFGNKKTAFSCPYGHFIDKIKKFKRDFCNHLELIGEPEEAGFHFLKVDESGISATSVATHHGACVTNDVLNYAEEMIKDALITLKTNGVVMAEQKIYGVYMYFFQKIKRFIQTGRAVRVSFELSVILPEKYEEEVAKTGCSYYFSIHPRHAHNDVYTNMAYFLMDLSDALQAVIEKYTGQKKTRGIMTLEAFEAETADWRRLVEGIRPRLAKMREKLSIRAFRRRHPLKKRIVEEAEDEFEEISWEDFEDIVTGGIFAEDDDSEEILATVIETTIPEKSPQSLHEPQFYATQSTLSLFDLEILKQE